MSNSYDYLLKFILIGDSSVGKSCLLNRFVQGKFKNQHDPTLGVQFGCKNITVEGQALKIQIWDTAGQESFKSITRSYYKGSVAAFFVYDISRRQTFEGLAKWLHEVRNYANQKIQIALIGNKIDLAPNRQISEEQARDFAKQNNFTYFQTSALNGTNINSPFEEISQRILHKINSKQIDPEEQNFTGIRMGRKKKSGSSNGSMQINRSKHQKSSNSDKCKC